MVLVAVVVITGGWLTVSVKFCVAFGLTPLLAVIVKVYVPPDPTAGVPLRTPVALKVTPLGRVPVTLKVGVGKPLAVTVKVPAWASVNVALAALVKVGATF